MIQVLDHVCEGAIWVQDLSQTLFAYGPRQVLRQQAWSFAAESKSGMVFKLRDAMAALWSSSGGEWFDSEVVDIWTGGNSCISDQVCGWQIACHLKVRARRCSVPHTDHPQTCAFAHLQSSRHVQTHKSSSGLSAKLNCHSDSLQEMIR